MSRAMVKLADGRELFYFEDAHPGAGLAPGRAAQDTAAQQDSAAQQNSAAQETTAQPDTAAQDTAAQDSAAQDTATRPDAVAGLGNANTGRRDSPAGRQDSPAGRGSGPAAHTAAAGPAERDLAVPDLRDLPPRPLPSELRYDPLLDEWVAIAAHRQTRTFLPPSDECPLCPSTPLRRSEVPAAGYDVAVFENRFPSFSGGLPASVASPAGSETPGPTPFTPLRPGAGRCEVVCFTADHDASFASLTPRRVRTVIDALAERTAELSRLPEVEQVFCFENRGVEIGVTLHHPHGQIYATPFVTPRTRAMLAAAGRYAERTGGANLYADVLAAERESGERIVTANEHWTAYVPAAARWPFEVHVAPHRVLPDLPALSDEERDALAPLYLDLLRRFDALFDRPMPYIAAWHQAPVRGRRDLAYLHLQVFSIRRAADKLKFLAGSESAMGVFINDIGPEQAAERLRKAGESVIPRR